MADTGFILVERASALDAEPVPADLHADFDPDIAHFIRVIQAVIPPGSSAQLPPPVTAKAADAALANCELMRRLTAKAAEITIGPVPRQNQYWVSTGRPSYIPPRPDAVNRSHFVDVATVERIPASTKPFDVGLYTSSGVLGTFGMWWCSLHVNSESTLFPRPWKLWSLQVAADAIATAADWVDFVSAASVRKDDFLYPDWRRVAARHDGIHMTVKAIAATQGLCFYAGTDVVAPRYWDVESTLRLRWVFDRVQELGDAAREESRSEGCRFSW